MGVATRADELLDEARDALDKAGESLAEFVFGGDVWGAEDYGVEFKGDVADVLSQVAQMRKKLG